MILLFNGCLEEGFPNTFCWSWFRIPLVGGFIWDPQKQPCTWKIQTLGTNKRGTNPHTLSIFSGLVVRPSESEVKECPDGPACPKVTESSCISFKSKKGWNPLSLGHREFLLYVFQVNRRSCLSRRHRELLLPAVRKQN